MNLFLQPSCLSVALASSLLLFAAERTEAAPERPADSDTEMFRPGGGPPSWLDRDRDGSPSAEDCDDLDSARYPGNLERCDGLDNDCDGRLPAEERCCRDVADRTWRPFVLRLEHGLPGHVGEGVRG